MDTLVAAWHRTERCPLVHIPQRCNADPAQIPRAHGCDCGCAPLRGLATWSATFASCHLDAATCSSSWNPEIMFWCLEVDLPDSLHPSLATRAGAWQHSAAGVQKSHHCGVAAMAGRPAPVACVRLCHSGSKAVRLFVRAAGEHGGIATNHETSACAFKSSQLVLHPQLGPQLEPPRSYVTRLSSAMRTGVLSPTSTPIGRNRKSGRHVRARPVGPVRRFTAYEANSGINFRRVC